MEQQSRRLLIIDDDPAVCQSIQAAFETLGFEVKVAGDGERGLEEISLWMPDLILLDIRMPGKDGWSVLKELRSNPETRDLPLIMLTEVDDDESKVLGFRGGVDDYIVKPFHFLELSARVERMLEVRQRAGRTMVGVPPMEKIPVQRGEKVNFIPRREVCFVEAAGKYSYLHTSAERFLTDMGLKEIEDAMMAPELFFRVHRSYLVNLGRVKNVLKEAPGRYIVQLDDEKESMIYVSERRLRAFKDILHLNI